MQHVLCYVSTAKKEFENSEITDLFEHWQKKNGNKEIKGILLYSKGHFFQVLEGERTAVLALFSKINKDRRHTGIIQVLGKDIQKGSLSSYITEHLLSEKFSRPELVKEYCESVKDMDSRTQKQINTILESFIDTRVL